MPASTEGVADLVLCLLHRFEQSQYLSFMGAGLTSVRWTDSGPLIGNEFIGEHLTS
jgi:hypothetical protein